MTDPRILSIKDFTYSLPEERIAKYPLAERDASKVLIYKEGIIAEDIYRNIADHIPSNSLLVFNDTKVVEARLLFQKPTGGVIEIFCLEPHEQYTDITTAMLQYEKVLWYCLIGGASKWKHGQILEKKISDFVHPFDRAKKRIILHPLSKGSASDWSLMNYRDLIALLPASSFEVFITGTKEEGEKIKLQCALTGSNVHDVTGKFSLGELIVLIRHCDVLVAASTGPLHIAAASGIA